MSVSILSSRWDLKREGVLFVVAFPSPCYVSPLFPKTSNSAKETDERAREGWTDASKRSRKRRLTVLGFTHQTPGVFSHVSLLAALSY